MRNVTWQMVALGLGFMIILFGSAIFLAYLKADVVSIFNLVLAAILTILTFIVNNAKNNLETKMDNVKEVANGRLSQVMDDNKRLQEQITALALQVQPRMDTSAAPTSPASPAA